MRKVMLMIGTGKGAFLATSGPGRNSWDLKGPFLKGSEVHCVTFLPKTNTLVSTLKSGWFGPGVRLSSDLGETWTEPERGVRFEESRGKSVEWPARYFIPVRMRVYITVNTGALESDGGGSARL